MIEKIEFEKNPIIPIIKGKIRFLFFAVGFLIAILYSIILGLLYTPLSSSLVFSHNRSLAVLILSLFVALLCLYLSIKISRQTLRITEDHHVRLNRLLNITKGLREEVHSDILLDKIMDYALSITGSDAGSLLLLENGKELAFKIVRGEKASLLLGTSIETGKGLIGWSAEKGLPLRIDDASKDERFNPAYDTLTGFVTRSIMCIPLKAKGKVIGELVLLNKKSFHPYRRRDEEIITYLADQAAISILKTAFIEDQKNYEIHLTQILLETMDVQLSDKRGHSQKVARYSNVIAKALQMSEEIQKKLYVASLLHDVGFLKMRSDDAFNRSELLKHPVVGYEMIEPINFYNEIAPLIRHHHERYDGHGYPSRLKGTEIPLEARIISIAEAFDAMTSATSYKIPIRFEDALVELRQNAGTQFDPDLVEIFIEHILPGHTQ